MHLLDRFRDHDDCRCTVSFEEPTGTGITDRVELVVDADDCPAEGNLATADCRARVVNALSDRDADVVRTHANGRERIYADGAAALLVAAGRFVERVAFHDDRLAERAERDPLRAAHEATGRADAAATIVAETGLAEVVAGLPDAASEGETESGGYGRILTPFTGPTVARSRVRLAPPADARLVDRWSLDTGATVRIYDDGGDLQRYHLEPVAHTLDDDAMATLAAAEAHLAHGGVDGGSRAPGRAVRRVADDDDPVTLLADELAKYTRGHGVLDDCFADACISDVFVTAPVTANPVCVTVDGEPMRTNVRLTPGGAAALASRFRRTSGRPFSRASPTIDAVVDAGTDGSVRVAGVSSPASDGVGFAFRRHDAEAWTLPALVANDTLPADAAALLSVAVERAAAGLVAGTRGAGKTTLLSALLWEIPASTRTVTIEDTRELPVESLQRLGRDVQPLYAGTEESDALTPMEAVRTALRLGEGALVVGEVRGSEAAALYEAMRVGANGSAVLGTIHGTGGAAVRERVVSDLGVPESSFGATDLLVTLAGGTSRHVARIEEVRTEATTGNCGLRTTNESGRDVRFTPLFERRGEEADGGRDGRLTATGVVDRGDSALIATLARPDERYADVRTLVAEREALFDDLTATDRTRPADVVRAYRNR